MAYSCVSGERTAGKSSTLPAMQNNLDGGQAATEQPSTSTDESHRSGSRRAEKTEKTDISEATIDERFSLTQLLQPGTAVSDIANDVQRGLTTTPKELPPKYFYDEYGAQLFDKICDTPEYYQTRTEMGLLQRIVGQLMDVTRPTHLVELGSGAARKTRVLLDRLVERAHRPQSVPPGFEPPRYMPVDISAEMLRVSARNLLRDYPTLHVHGVVADYEQHLHQLPVEGRRLIAFLGSTIGNFEHRSAVRFIHSIARGMRVGDYFLLGVDLVKDHNVLDAAYNDAQGITAEFNLNVLSVINRDLDADFDIDAFEHVAQYVPESARIEMHLRSLRAQNVRIGALDMTVHFSAGELMRTEISRKFTQTTCESMVRASGLVPEAWYISDNGYFALSLSRLSE